MFGLLICSVTPDSRGQLTHLGRHVSSSLGRISHRGLVGILGYLGHSLSKVVSEYRVFITTAGQMAAVVDFLTAI